MKNKTRSNKLTSSRHCFWHIWQYQRSFWRPLALIRFPIALGLRKSAFPILISQKNQDLQKNNNSSSVSTLPTLPCVVTRIPRFANMRVSSLIRVYLNYREIMMRTSFCGLFAPAQTGSSDLHWSEYVRQDQRGGVPPTMVRIYWFVEYIFFWEYAFNVRF